MTISFDKPVDGVIHIIEHPGFQSDRHNLNTGSGTAIPVGAHPSWQLLFVERVEKQMLGTVESGGSRGNYGGFHDMPTGKTCQTLVYGFVEPAESVIKRLAEDLDQSQRRASKDSKKAYEAESALATSRTALEAATKINAKLQEDLELARQTNSAEMDRRRDLGKRLRAMEDELAAVKTYFGAAEYAKAIAAMGKKG